MRDKTTTEMGTHHLSYFGYHSHELVYGNRAPPWHRGVGHIEEGFLVTFSFEDGFVSINEAIQGIKAVIFIMMQEPMEWIQLY